MGAFFILPKAICNFTEGKIQFKNIDEKFCEAFKDYLLSKVSKNPASFYFSKFKTTLKMAIKEKIIHSNPASFGLNY